MKKIKITHPCGKVEIIKGNFKDGVEIELLEEEPEMYWWDVIHERFYIEEDSDWPRSFAKTGASTKKQAILNDMQDCIKRFSHNTQFHKWMLTSLNALKQLDN